MAAVTDPARELAEIAERLTHDSSSAGESFLAGVFGVEPWSTEFMKIIVCILERTDLVARILQQSDAIDDDHKASALSDLAGFKLAFTGTALRVPWNQGEGGLPRMKSHGHALQFFSPTVRTEVRYPKLSDEEIEEFVELIDAYLDELAVSDEGPEFVRLAIRDGLIAFRFQLEQIGWMGSGYALAAFREVMLAYEATKWQYSSDGDFDSVAILRGLTTIVSKFKEKIDTAQGWADAGKSALEFYQLGSGVVLPLLLAKTHGL